MNAFDEECGPLAEQAECERIALLSAAGVTLDEMRAYSRYLMGVDYAA